MRDSIRARLSRRAFVRGGLVLASGVVVGPVAAQDSAGLAGQGAVGTLQDPTIAGRSQPRTTAYDNDPVVKAAELRLACTCGCTLAIYTCRTTDFTCTYAPALHLEIAALREEGKGEDEIVAAFVAKYGEKVLMAPEPRGFNLAGYLVPGAVVTVVGGALAWVLLRRTRVKGVSPSAAPIDVRGRSAGAGVEASPAELARLERELAQDG